MEHAVQILHHQAAVFQVQPLPGVTAAAGLHPLHRAGKDPLGILCVPRQLAAQFLLQLQKRSVAQCATSSNDRGVAHAEVSSQLAGGHIADRAEIVQDVIGDRRLLFGEARSVYPLAEGRHCVHEASPHLRRKTAFRQNYFRRNDFLYFFSAFIIEPFVENSTNFYIKYCKCNIFVNFSALKCSCVVYFHDRFWFIVQARASKCDVTRVVVLISRTVLSSHFSWFCPTCRPLCIAGTSDLLYTHLKVTIFSLEAEFS